MFVFVANRAIRNASSVCPGLFTVFFCVPLPLRRVTAASFACSLGGTKEARLEALNREDSRGVVAITFFAKRAATECHSAEYDEIKPRVMFTLKSDSN